VQSVQSMEACSTSLFGEPKYQALVGGALGGTRRAPFCGVCECRSSLTTGGGVQDDLLIVTCIHPGLSWVEPVESLDCVFCMVEVF